MQYVLDSTMAISVVFCCLLKTTIIDNHVLLFYVRVTMVHVRSVVLECVCVISRSYDSTY